MITNKKNRKEFTGLIVNKSITKMIVVIMVMSVVLCVVAIAFADQLTELNKDGGIQMEYESKLFDVNNIDSINILMDEDEWSEMLADATSEIYYQCDVVINGTTFYSVGIRPKGNTSLTSIASDPNNNRYSFKLEFDQFVDGQTCWGLDKLILNNNFADSTNMKEAVIYDMYQYLDADASLYNYASISLNGEYWGVYLALEAVEDSFMLRNYGVESGELYKPETMDMGGGGPGGGEFGFGGGGANLNYTDDNLDSYSAIWDGAIYGTSTKKERAVVTALENISNGTDLEKYMDVDNLLKYMAVHNFAVNEDSLSGSMSHNYYLYEYEGQLNILPWDYNLSLGGMGNMGAERMGEGDTMDGATSMINDPIDTPFDGTNFFDTLLENEEYLERYHEYYRQLVEEYILNGGFDETYNRIRSQIDTLVAEDPNAMYTYEEYDAGADMLYQTVMLRAQSVQGQLNGTVPSTKEAQSANPEALLDGSSIDTEVMGTFGGGSGGGPGGGPGGDFEGEFPGGGPN